MNKKKELKKELKKTFFKSRFPSFEGNADYQKISIDNIRYAHSLKKAAKNQRFH